MSDEDGRYEVDRSVATWDIRHLARAEVGDVQSFLDSAVELSQRPEIDAGVVRLPDQGTIAGEVFDMVEQYGQFFVDHGIERIALVSHDIKNIAIKSKLRVEGMNVEAMDDFDAAVEWAHGEE